MSQASGGQPEGPTPTALERRQRFASADPMRQLLRIADGRMPDLSLLRDALRCAGVEFGAVFGLLKATHRGASFEDYYHAGPADPKFWKEPALGVLAQAMARGNSVDRRYRSKSGGLHVAMIASPLRDDAPEPSGGIVLVVEIEDEAKLERARVELRAFATMLATLMRPRVAAPGDKAPQGIELRAASIAGGASGRTTVAIAITNQLRAKLGCEQVALGVVRRKRVTILSISGFSDVSQRTPGAQAIVGAMEECFDLDRSIAVSANRIEGDTCPLHRHWSAEAEGAFVATIPLRESAKEGAPVSAVLALRHAPGRAFSAEDLKKISDTVAAYAPALRMAELANRSLIAHAIESVVRHIAGIRHRRGAFRLACTLAILATLGWVAFGQTMHQVSAKARIAPTLVQHLTAPFDGRIATAHVMEGDRVAAGTVLFTLDTSAMEVERARLQAAVRSSEVEAEGARAKGDHAQARLVIARGDVDRASLASVERRIADAVVRATSDGIVLRGDLRERLGAAAANGETLLEFVPIGELRVLLEISERDVLQVKEGDNAEFRPQARPDLTLHMRIERIRPAAEVHGAENVFIAEATLDTIEPWMRVGVEGAARVDSGETPVWYALFHRLIGWVRLRLWV